MLQKSRTGAAVPFELGVATASIDLTSVHRRRRRRCELGEGDEQRRPHAIDARVEWHGFLRVLICRPWRTARPKDAYP